MTMFVLYLYTLVLFFWSVKGFFLSSPTAVPPISIICYVGEYVQIENIYTNNYNGVWRSNNSLTRLCAVREDRGLFNASNFLRRTYTSSSITNTLRQMARTRCQGFSNRSDLGYGTCTPQSFELYNSTKLCICATNFCNRDFFTCQKSVISSNSSQTILPQVVPSLTTPVRCYENTEILQYNPYYSTRNGTSVCIPSYQYSSRISSYVPTTLIDQDMCETYVTANSVLCAVDASSTSSSYNWNGNEYIFWPQPHMIRYTAEDYTKKLLAPLIVDNGQYNGYNNSYLYDSNTPNYVNTIYEGLTNVVVRRDAYDLVGNSLDISALYCFCSTDNCNIDFETCAWGINYNSTSSTTIDSTASTTTVTTRPTGTTINSSMLSLSMIVFYSFDGNALDLFSTYNGTLMGGATFTPVGYVRQALLLSSNTQYVQTSFINVAYQSFTISGWISTTNLVNATIFSQCSARAARKCLMLRILNRYLFMDFFGGFNATGTTILTASKWFHVAFVYDQVVQQQLIYLNGIENGRSAPGLTPPYIGTCQPVNIGVSLIGSIDQLSVTNRVKSANEILTDGTLTAAYSFNGNLLDSGPNGLNGTGLASFNNGGRLGQALQLTNTSAPFQSTGLTGLTIPSQPFSISIWLKPQITLGGSSVLVLSATNWCMQLLGFTSSGILEFKINGFSASARNLSNTDWTHLVYSYSSINGARLFINGNFVDGLQKLFTPGNLSMTLNVGSRPSSNPSCTSALIAAGRYQGLVDELKVFSRELSSTDITALANP